jgi:hypothetical protein
MVHSRSRIILEKGAKLHTEGWDRGTTGFRALQRLRSVLTRDLGVIFFNVTVISSFGWYCANALTTNDTMAATGHRTANVTFGHLKFKKI